MIGYKIAHAPVGVDKTVIVLPGSPGSRRVQFAKEALDGLDARVVMTERPGFGTTPREPERTLADHVHQIVEVADDLGADRFAVVGWSAGGTYALACGALAPERVAVVVLLSAHVSSYDRPEADGRMSSHAQMIVGGLRTDPAGTKEAVASFLQPQADAYALDPGAFKEKWMLDSAATWGRRPADYWLDVLEDVIGKPPSHLADEFAITNGPLGFGFDEVRVPVRAFHGILDSNVPIGGMHDLVSRLPDATLTEWDDENHFASAAAARVALEAAASYL